MTPLHTLLICELFPHPSVERNHSAASVQVPKTLPVSIHMTAFACTWAARLSGVLNRSKAFLLASLRASGLEKYLIVFCRVFSISSGLENRFKAITRNFSLTSGRFITSNCLSKCACLYSGLANRSLALALKLLRHLSDHRCSKCFCLVSSVMVKPDAPSPPLVRLQRPWSLYFKINSHSSSKAHHSCIPVCTISMV